MLGGRVAGPLVSLAGLVEDVQRARSAIAQVGSVLNRPTEKRGADAWLAARNSPAPHRIRRCDIKYRAPKHRRWSM